MEYNSGFLEVKAALEHFEVRTGIKLSSYDHLTTEGAKTRMKVLISSLRKIELFTKGSEDNLRRLHLFLLLNTKLPVSNLLEEDRSCGHLIGRCPKISPYIYFCIVNHLELFPFMAETILLVPNEFSGSLLELFINNIKYISDPFDELTALKLISISAFKKLCKNVSTGSSNFKLTRQFQEILLFYKKPSQFTAQKLVSWSKLELHKYYGFLVLSLISVLLESTNNVSGNSSENFPVMTVDNIYDFSVFKASPETICREENVLLECYELIIGVSKTFLADKISSSTFLDWVEIDITETRTLQRIIGEKVFLCRKALIEMKQDRMSKNLKNTLKDLIFCLSHLEIKPLTLAEEIKELNVNQLIAKLEETHVKNSDEENVLILRSVIQDQQAFLEVSKIIAVLEKYGSFLKFDDFKYLIKTAHSESDVVPKSRVDEFEKTVFESIKNLPFEEQVSMLEWYLDSYAHHQPSHKDDSNFEEKLIEVFNKFVSNSSSSVETHFSSEVISLCFYSVGDVVVKILVECIKNSNYIKNMVPVLKMLRPSVQRIQSISSLENKLKAVRKISENEELVKSILENTHGDFLIDLIHILIFDESTKQDSAKRTNILDLVNSLVDEAVIEKNTFYLEVILDNIHLRPKISYLTVNFLLQFLFKALVESPDDTLDVEIHVVLVQLAHLLEKVRWEPSNYTSWRSAMVSNLVFLISSIVKKSATQINSDSKKSSWLESYVKSFSPSTQFLFSIDSLWPQQNSNIIHFKNQPVSSQILVLNAMYNEKFDFSALSKISEIEMAWAFFKVLSVSCNEEWNLFSLTLNSNKLFNKDVALSIFNHLTNAVLIGIKLMEIGTNEDESKVRPWLSCYNNLLTNFNSFTMNFLLKYLLMNSTSVKSQLFRKLTLLLQTVPPKIKAHCSGLFLRLLISFIPHLLDSIDSKEDATLFMEIFFNSVRGLDVETRQPLAKKAHLFLLEKVPSIFQ